MDESLAIRRAALGDRHPQVGSTLMVKANLRLAELRPEEALQLARESREILAAGLPPDHWLLAAATSVEGAALVRLRRYTEAEPLLIATARWMVRRSRTCRNAPGPGSSSCMRHGGSRNWQTSI